MEYLPPPPTSSGFESSSIFETFLFSLYFHQNTLHYSNLFQEITMAKPPIRTNPKMCGYYLQESNHRYLFLEELC